MFIDIECRWLHLKLLKAVQLRYKKNPLDFDALISQLQRENNQMVKCIKCQFAINKAIRQYDDLTHEIQFK